MIMYKRKSCRFILYLFAISLLCLCCLNTQAAGKKIAIKGVSKTLKIPMGEKYYLEAKSKPTTKLTYSSSNKSILKVSKKGVLNPRNVGKAKITIKARKKGNYAAARKTISVTVVRGERMADDDYMSYFFHMGEAKVKKKWTPYKKYTDIKVTYKSSNSSVVSISKKGKITLKKPGSVTLTAKVKKTKKYKAAKALIYVTVLPDKEGLYSDDVGNPHFYYQKKQYLPGSLPRDTEIKLCKNNPHLKKFLEEYLPRYRAQISDPAEAGLTAILNYGADYCSKKNIFNPLLGGSIDADNSLWSVLLYNHKGACIHFSSLFSYLCYLSGVPCMSIEDFGHAWNIIYYKGYYYSVENHYFLVKPRQTLAMPPFSKATAKVFRDEIVNTVNVQPGMQKAGWIPTDEVGKMGQDLTAGCPILSYSKTDSGEYRVHFDKLDAGHRALYPSGEEVKLTDLIHLQMESETKNPEIYPAFRKADLALQEELKKFY